MKLLIAALWFAVMASGQQLPAWLDAFPGSKEGAKTSTPSMAEINYTAAAKPDEIVAHYCRTFDAARVPFVAAFDGAGTSIRAAAAGCDLLIRIRETSDSGSTVRVSCSARAMPAAAQTSAAPAVGFGGSAPPVQSDAARTRGSSSSDPAAQYEDARRRRTDVMKAYDKPNYKHARKPPKSPIW